MSGGGSLSVCVLQHITGLGDMNFTLHFTRCYWVDRKSATIQETVHMNECTHQALKKKDFRRPVY